MKKNEFVPDYKKKERWDKLKQGKLSFKDVLRWLLDLLYLPFIQLDSLISIFGSLNFVSKTFQCPFIAISNECTQCGICAEGCPVGAIDSENSNLIDKESSSIRHKFDYFGCLFLPIFYPLHSPLQLLAQVFPLDLLSIHKQRKIPAKKLPSPQLIVECNFQPCFNNRFFALLRYYPARLLDLLNRGTSLSPISSLVLI